MYAMDTDDQSDVLKLPNASANGATAIVQDEPADAPVEPNPKTTAIDTAPIPLETFSQRPAPLAEPPEPTLNDITQLIQDACDTKNFTQANSIITQHTKILLASTEGITLGLRASIALGMNVNFYSLMHNAGLKLTSDIVDQLLITAATHGRSFHAESLFQYRYGVPVPSLKAINSAIIAAAANGYPAFIELLFDVSKREASKDLDWLIKPSLRQLSLIVPPYLCAAYLYDYARGYSAISGQTSNYHYTALAHFMRDLFIMNACIFMSKMLIKPIIAKYVYNYKFASPFDSDTMDKALIKAAQNGHIDTIKWLLQDRSAVKALNYKIYIDMTRPSLEGAMKALLTICFRPGIKNRLPILDKLLTEIPSFINKDVYQREKDEFDRVKLLLLMGTYILKDRDCADRLRAENMPLSQNFIDNQFERSLSIDDDSLKLFLAPNLPEDLRVSRDKVREALTTPRIKDNPSLVNMFRLHLNPIPLMPFNNWIAALSMSEESDLAPQVFKKIVPPPSVSLRTLLANIFENLYQYIDQNDYVWNIVNGTQLAGIMEGLGQPTTWSDDEVETSTRPVIVACDDENTRRFKDAEGNHKTVEYMFQMAKMTGDSADIIPIRLWPAANQDVSKVTPRSPVLEVEKREETTK